MNDSRRPLRNARFRLRFGHALGLVLCASLIMAPSSSWAEDPEPDTPEGTSVDPFAEEAAPKDESEKAPKEEQTDEPETPDVSSEASADTAPPATLDTGALDTGGSPTAEADEDLAKEAEATAVRAPSPHRERFPISGGLELGSLFAQTLSKLGTSLAVTLELAYLAPVMEQRLALYTDFSYVMPSHSAEASDPRLFGPYSFEVTTEELLWTLGAMYRFLPLDSELNFYGQAGWRFRFQRSTVSGTAAGQSLGENEETATEAVGLVLAGGAEYALGPGALAAELELAFGDLDQRVTGDATAGGLALKLGYHVLF